MRKCFESAGLALLCFMMLAPVAVAAEFARERLEIHRGDGKVLVFEVELALDDPGRQQGLMDRDEMAEDHGMLFDFGRTRPVYMWMKNTYLPLDMLFISDKGRIEHIAENTLPLSEGIIDSRGPVRFVLEINGGLAAKLGIAKGDRVRSPHVDAAAPRP